MGLTYGGMISGYKGLYKEDLSRRTVQQIFFILSNAKTHWARVNLFDPPHPVNPAFKQPDSVADLRVVLG